MDPMKMTPEMKEELVRQAQADHVRSLLFTAAYSAFKKTAQHMLDQFAKNKVPADDGVEIVHTALGAVTQGFRLVAIEHVKAPIAAVDESEKRARALGEKIYRDSWGVLLKNVGPSKIEGAVPGSVPGESGLVGPDGKPL